MSANKVIAILAGVVFILAVVGAFFLGRATKTLEPLGRKVERDTIVVRDTVRERYPEPVVEYRTRIEYVRVPVVERVVERDTVRDTVLAGLPITEREYKSDEYYAIVEGYDPRLKYFEVYPRTAYINATETITKRKRWGVTLGVQGGYGFTPKGWQPYAGIGVTFGYTF